jgi:hypothetical protein
MNLIVNDANILFDLIDIGLVDEFFILNTRCTLQIWFLMNWMMKHYNIL